MSVPDEAVEAAARALAGEREWQAHSDAWQLDRREDARRSLEAAAPFIELEIARDIREGMEAWAGSQELAFLEGYIDASEDLTSRKSGT